MAKNIIIQQGKLVNGNLFKKNGELKKRETV